MHGAGLMRAARFLTHLVYAFALVAPTILAFGFFRGGAHRRGAHVVRRA